MGTPAMTTRGLDAVDFEVVAEHLHQAVTLALEIQERSGPKLAAFAEEMEADPKVGELRERVQNFARTFPMP